MKRIVSLLLIIMLTLGLQAKSHLKFMSIPINNKTEFIKNLKRKGFTENALGYFEGVFAGQDAKVHPSMNGSVLIGVSVLLQAGNSKDEAGKCLNDWADKFSYKYKTSFVKNDDGNFEGNVKNGVIIISSLFISNNYYILIGYFDNANSNKQYKKELNDL